MADKLYHLLEYGILGILLTRVLVEYGFFPSPLKKIIGVLLISFLYGLSDEFHQWFVPGRSAVWGDVLADSLGGGLGGWFYLRFISGFPRTNKAKKKKIRVTKTGVGVKRNK
ncbi:MAG: VanZ family protein [Thermodesulfobacteriota bacterium]